jgi:hypothetical protein
MIVGAMHHRLSRRPPLALLACAAAWPLAACSPGPPPPAPVGEGVAAANEDALAPLSSHASAQVVARPTPAAAERPDPTEDGISDLARLARYVFREMQAREASCRLDNPFHERLAFTLRIPVERGRMRTVSLASARLERPGGPNTLAAAEWPQALTGYVACLEPFLTAIAMRPAPADGSYDAEYSFGGHGG